jgi:hypothetical protein
MFYRFLILLMLFGIAGAHASNVKIGPTTIVLPRQPGFCELDESKAADKRMLVATRGMVGTNLLLSMEADCGQLTTWRTKTGTLLQNFIQYQTMSSWVDKPIAASAIKDTCDELAKEGEKLAADQLPDTRSRAEVFLKKVEVQGSQFLGVLENKPGEVCFSSLLTKFKADTGSNVAQLTVWATTRIRDKLVYLYYFAPYSDANSLTTALANLRVYYSSLVAANR